MMCLSVKPEAEINLCVKRARDMRRGGFSINSAIITNVRQNDECGLMLLVNQSPLLASSGGINAV